MSLDAGRIELQFFDRLGQFTVTQRQGHPLPHARLVRQVGFDPFPLLIRELVASPHDGPSWLNQSHRRIDTLSMNVRTT